MLNESESICRSTSKGWRVTLFAAVDRGFRSAKLVERMLISIYIV